MPIRSGVVSEMRDIKINAEWNAEAKVWIVRSDDVPGLSIEAATLDALWQKLNGTVPELIAATSSPTDVGAAPLMLVICCSPWMALCSYLKGFA